MTTTIPRLVVAGTGGDAGKTLVCLALAAAWRRGGVRVAAFKKGPDYIDRAWLAWATGRETRNLDAYLMPKGVLLASFRQGALGAELALVEGNRGLYDGLDVEGTYSTAELAKTLAAPVVLLLDATKVTRTLAAVALGMQRMDPQCPLGAVILNRVAGARHEARLREAVTGVTGLPVLGAIPREKDLGALLPDRHLGLVTPEEHADPEALQCRLLWVGETYLDLHGLFALAQSAPPLPGAEAEEGGGDKVKFREEAPEVVRAQESEASEAREEAPEVVRAQGGAFLGREPFDSRTPFRVEIGYFTDRAFTFYYPENLSALTAEGARLVPISAMTAPVLPPVHALYIGGGFPETQAAALQENRGFRETLAEAARQGLPIYAECGGLMYLCRSLWFQGERYEMANVFPLDLVVGTRPRGHGYVEVEVDGENPFFPLGTRLRGHEFHYSQLKSSAVPPITAYAVRRGVGTGGGRDGLRCHRILASYLHLHALGCPEWAPGLVRAAQAFGAPPGAFLD